MKLFLAGLIGALPLFAQAPSQDYPIRPVPFTDVHLDDSFWAPRLEINRKETIPFAFKQCEITGRVSNFIHAAEALRHELDNPAADIPKYPFDDSDVYKVIEGASYTLSVDPDPKLTAYIDGVIAKIAAAQEPDGYIYTARTIDPQHPHQWSGTERWQNEEIGSHELYDLGHLYEAATAYYQATGKRNLLDIAIKSANMLCNTFGPGKRAIWPGHQVVEMGLVKLYRVTGDQRYLELAKFMLDVRGGKGGSEYNQSQVRVVDQTEAVGHAVRATYMYSGMADVAAMTGDQAYVNAIDRIWNNVVEKKLYITGGIGAIGAYEGFGANYELPNLTAYNETCASVGNDFWNERLFLLHGDAKYVDVLERTLYNGLLSGVSLDGKSFFYPNPLESNGYQQRSPWFGVACCPGNITRFLPSLPGYFYAVGPNSTVFVNLYASSSATVDVAGEKLTLVQQTRYPWDGEIRLTVKPAVARDLTLKVRIPGWARGEAVPGDLYRFIDQSADRPTVMVNGAPVAMNLENGYVPISRKWKAGDVIAVHLPMPVRRVAANSQVAADRNHVAIQRGPIVYAFEWPDAPDHKVRNLVLEDDARLAAVFEPKLLNGVEAVKTHAVALSYDQSGALKRREFAVTAVPYYAWANRGRGEMEVWIADADSAARPNPYPTLAMRSKVSVSGTGETVSANGTRKYPEAVNDGDETSHFDWWPEKGHTEWIQYTLPAASEVSGAKIDWFDDSGHGEVRAPASWRILYLGGQNWTPVKADKQTGTEIHFAPVKTAALRLEVTMQPQWSAGISEWKLIQ